MILYRIEGFCKRNFATLYTTIEESLEDILAKYEAFIKISLVTTVTTTNINMQVVQTNKCIISLMKRKPDFDYFRNW
jgi:N-acetyl-gamma-glutamyl-phosphate reductase